MCLLTVYYHNLHQGNAIDFAIINTYVQVVRVAVTMQTIQKHLAGSPVFLKQINDWQK